MTLTEIINWAWAAQLALLAFTPTVCPRSLPWWAGKHDYPTALLP